MLRNYICTSLKGDLRADVQEYVQKHWLKDLNSFLRTSIESLGVDIA